MNDFASRILKARAEAGMTQRELSEKTGISTVQLSRYESGKSTPRAPVRVKLADALKVNPDWLGGSNSFDKAATVPLTVEFNKRDAGALDAVAKEFGIPVELFVLYSIFSGMYEMGQKMGDEKLRLEAAKQLEAMRDRLNEVGKRELPSPVSKGDLQRLKSGT